jgi:hypothetical protein
VKFFLHYDTWQNLQLRPFISAHLLPILMSSFQAQKSIPGKDSGISGSFWLSVVTVHSEGFARSAFFDLYPLSLGPAGGYFTLYTDKEPNILKASLPQV